MGCGPHSCLATFLGPPNLMVEPPAHTRTNSLPSSWGLRTQHETNKKVIAVSGRERIDNRSVVLVVQSCLTFCNPMDCSLPGSSVMEFSRQENTGIGCHALLQGIFLIKVYPKNKIHKSHNSENEFFWGGLGWILVEEHRIFSCGMWALVPLLGFKPESPVLQRGVLTTGQPGKTRRTSVVFFSC